MMNVQEKVNEITADSEFVERLKNAHSAEEVSALFEEKGVLISPEEVEQAILIAEEYNGDELSEEQLDTVAGGFAIGSALLVAGLALLAIGVVRGFIDAAKKKYG